MLNKKTVDDLKDLQGKKVLVRCDFNVPLKDGVIQNYNRIDGALPTIKKLLEQGAKVILCSHPLYRWSSACRQSAGPEQTDDRQSV